MPAAAGDEPSEPITYAELTSEEIDREAEQMEAQRGTEAATQLRAVAPGRHSIHCGGAETVALDAS